MNRKLITIVLLVLLSLGFLNAREAESLRQLLSYFDSEIYVSRVHDGDTVDVLNRGSKETIRLIGVDTPETHHPNKDVQCFGEAASGFLREILENETVQLIADKQSDNKDVYGRLLRYVEYEGEDINKKIISEGYGFAMRAFPHTRMQSYIEAEQHARANNLGLWSSCEISDGDYYQTNSLD